MSDTIAAYSGGGLPAAIGIIRLTGPRSVEILDRLFRPKGGKAITDCIPRTLYYGSLSDIGGKEIDICTAALYRAPRSYTGEDMAEIFCHGSAAIVSSALEHAFALGARVAEPGEFTKRAFLNGKLDLTQAEAVADLIYSPSAGAAQMAVAQLQGSVGGKVREIRRQITGLLAHFYAVCDYSDEEIDPFELEKAAKTLESAAARLERMKESFERGKYVREGIPVAITGRPNAGKSSLFNALCGFERAIVTEEAGTTRDLLDTVITCGSAAIRLLDTAGIRQAEGKAERMGIDRALDAIANSQAILLLTNCLFPPNPDDFKLLRLALQGPKCALILSKSDLVDNETINIRLSNFLKEGFTGLRGVNAESLPFESHDGKLAVFAISSVTGHGLDRLTHWLAQLAPAQTEELIITSARQAAAAASAARDLRCALSGALSGMTADAFLADAERAVNTLGQITGERASADIAGEIFSRFCVGK